MFGEMSNIQVPIHPMIQRIVQINYKFGVWQNEEDATLKRKIGRTIVYVIFSVGFAVSLIGGSLISDDYHDSLFLLTSGLIICVLNFKTFLNYSKANQILEMLQAICVHSIPNRDTTGQLLQDINRKLNNFKMFSNVFLALVITTILTFLILFFPPFLTKKELPFNIWFPLDWKTSLIAHWMAFSYIIFCLIFNSFICLLTVIKWYIMLSCSIKYEVLGNYFRNFGAVKNSELESYFDEFGELVKMFQKIEK